MPLLISGLFSALLGLVVLVGWYTHNTTLIQVLPSFVPMQYNTALGFFLAGVSILGTRFDRKAIAMWSAVITSTMFG